MSEYIQGLMAGNPNDPFPAKPPSFTEMLHRGLAASLPPAGQMQVANTGLGRTVGTGLRLGGSLAGIVGEEMGKRRQDPLGRILPLAERVTGALGDVRIPEISVPGQQVIFAPPGPPESPFGLEKPSQNFAMPPGLSLTGGEGGFAQPPGLSTLPPQGVGLTMPGIESSRRARSLAEAAPRLSAENKRGLIALQLAAPQTIKGEDLFLDPIPEQTRQLNELKLRAAPIEMREAERKRELSIADEARKNNFRQQAAAFMSGLDRSDKNYTQKVARGLLDIAARTDVQDTKSLLAEFINMNNAEVRLEIQKGQAAALANYRATVQKAITEREKNRTRMQSLNATGLAIQRQIQDIDKKLDAGFIANTKQETEDQKKYTAELNRRRKKLMDNLAEIQNKVSGMAGIESGTAGLAEFQKAMQDMAAGYRE